jgi:hypothetical protein
MKKQCWIRGEQKEKRCPFGLPIALACNNAGDSVTHMCPLEAISKDKNERVVLANKRVYLYHKTGQRCLYAVDVMDEVQAVNCDFGDVGQGMGMGGAISGSPLYAQTFSGIGLDGLYAFPMGFYADNNESRNLFQGLFSLLGAHAPAIIKTAIEEQENILWKKLKKGESLTSEERIRLENMVETCRQEFEANRSDSARARELSDKWNSRKGL